MYSSRCVAAVSKLGCCEKTVMSSTYDNMRLSECVGRGMSCMKKLNCIDEIRGL